MKVITSIKALKKVYASFKDAGISGLLTGEQEKVSAATIMDALIESDLMIETLKTVTGSDTYIYDDGTMCAWDEVPYALLNGVLADFFTGIGSVSMLAQRN